MATSNKKHRIFLSYTWEEGAGKEDVWQFFEYLDGSGHYDIWLDKNGNMSGNTNEAMEKGIYDSDLVVAFVSNVYQNKPNCRYELCTAVRLSRKVLFVNMARSGIDSDTSWNEVAWSSSNNGCLAKKLWDEQLRVLFYENLDLRNRYASIEFHIEKALGLDALHVDTPRVDNSLNSKILFKIIPPVSIPVSRSKIYVDYEPSLTETTSGMTNLTDLYHVLWHYLNDDGGVQFIYNDRKQQQQCREELKRTNGKINGVQVSVFVALITSAYDKEMMTFANSCRMHILQVQFHDDLNMDSRDFTESFNGQSYERSLAIVKSHRQNVHTAYHRNVSDHVMSGYDMRIAQIIRTLAKRGPRLPIDCRLYSPDHDGLNTLQPLRHKDEEELYHRFIKLGRNFNLIPTGLVIYGECGVGKSELVTRVIRKFEIQLHAVFDATVLLKCRSKMFFESYSGISPENKNKSKTFRERFTTWILNRFSQDVDLIAADACCYLKARNHRFGRTASPTYIDSKSVLKKVNRRLLLILDDVHGSHQKDILETMRDSGKKIACVIISDMCAASILTGTEHYVVRPYSSVDIIRYLHGVPALSNAGIDHLNALANNCFGLIFVAVQIASYFNEDNSTQAIERLVNDLNQTLPHRATVFQKAIILMQRLFLKLEDYLNRCGDRNLLHYFQTLFVYNANENIDLNNAKLLWSLRQNDDEMKIARDLARHSLIRLESSVDSTRHWIVVHKLLYHAYLNFRFVKLESRNLRRIQNGCDQSDAEKTPEICEDGEAVKMRQIVKQGAITEINGRRTKSGLKNIIVSAIEAEQMMQKVQHHCRLLLAIFDVDLSQDVFENIDAARKLMKEYNSPNETLRFGKSNGDNLFYALLLSEPFEVVQKFEEYNYHNELYRIMWKLFDTTNAVVVLDCLFTLKTMSDDSRFVFLENLRSQASDGTEYSRSRLWLLLKEFGILAKINEQKQRLKWFNLETSEKKSLLLELFSRNDIKGKLKQRVLNYGKWKDEMESRSLLQHLVATGCGEVVHNLLVPKLLTNKTLDFTNVNINGENILFDAASSNQIQIFAGNPEYTLETLNSKQRNKQKQFPTFIAARNGLVRMLSIYKAAYFALAVDDRGRNFLFEAAEHGHVQILDYIQADFLLNDQKTLLAQRDSEGKSVIFPAAEHGHLSFVIRLLSFELSFASRNSCASNRTIQQEQSPVTEQLQNSQFLVADINGRVPLFYAAMNCHDDIVKYFIGDNNLLFAKKLVDHQGFTPAHLALQLRDIGAVEIDYYESIGINLFAKDKNGQSIGTIAIRHQRPFAVAVTLSKSIGMDDRVKPNELTAMHVAAAAGNVAILKVVHEHMKQLTEVHDKNGRTPIFSAAVLDNDAGLEAVKFFVEKCGANLEVISTESGFPVLVEAVRIGNKAVGQYLERFGPLNFLSDWKGSTLLASIIESTDYKLLGDVFDFSQNQNIVNSVCNSIGETPIFIVCRLIADSANKLSKTYSSCLKMLDLILKREVDYSITKECNGNTILHEIISMQALLPAEKESIFQKIFARGDMQRKAPYNVKNVNGETVLMFSIKMKQPSIVKLLCDAGVDVYALDKDGYNVSRYLLELDPTGEATEKILMCFSDLTSIFMAQNDSISAFTFAIGTGSRELMERCFLYGECMYSTRCGLLLHHAITQQPKNITLITTLLDWIKDVETFNARDSQNQSALDLAKQLNLPAIVDLLLKRGVMI